MQGCRPSRVETFAEEEVCLDGEVVKILCREVVFPLPVVYYATSPLPIYGRWECDEGWHCGTTPYPNAVVTLRNISRDALFSEAYSGYAILDGLLFGLRAGVHGVTPCAPRANHKDESMGKTLQNTRVADGRVVGYHTDVPSG